MMEQNPRAVREAGGSEMILKVKELTDRRCSFVVEGTSPGVVNAIRRTLISEVPKMAIDEVEFHMGPIRDEEGNEYDSSSALFDEIIAHRMALVPIPTNLKDFTFRDKCECGGSGCPHCTIIYVMNKKGPCTVFSGDLQPLGDVTLRVKEELIPIVKLKEKQALLVYATAILGTGKDHAKWQSVTVCGYKYFPKLFLSSMNHKDPDNRYGVWDAEDEKFIVENLDNADLCHRCVQTLEANNANPEPKFDVAGRDDKFIFSFETDGSVKAKDALEYSLKLLAGKYDEFRDQISGLDEKKA